jgi:hypothetical protein
VIVNYQEKKKQNICFQTEGKSNKTKQNRNKTKQNKRLSSHPAPFCMKPPVCSMQKQEFGSIFHLAFLGLLSFISLLNPTCREAFVVTVG